METFPKKKGVERVLEGERERERERKGVLAPT